MNNNEFNADTASLSVDLSEARQAVKENRFQDALDLFEIILETDPDHIDSLYLISVASRYLMNPCNILNDCCLSLRIWVEHIRN